HGTMADELRRSGKLVVGGTPYSDKLEDDRAFGQQELKAAGVSIIPQANFTSFDDAMTFVRDNPNRYVIKPSGEAQNYKRLLFVGEEEDGHDVLQVLEDYKRAWADRIKEFQLQRRVMGVEVATGAFFNGREFVPPVCVNFEHKRLFPGDIGPSTGEMGTAMFWSEPNKIFNATLKKMEPRLAEEHYVGYIDINCIVNSNGIYPLEFTSRFGYPTISIQQEGLLTPLGELFLKLADGSLTRARARSGFQVGVRIVGRRFPLHDPEPFESNSKDAVILFKTPSRDGFHIEDVEDRERGVDGDRDLGRGADRVRHRQLDEAGPAPGLPPRAQRHDPEHVLPRGHRRPLAGGRQRSSPQLGISPGVGRRSAGPGPRTPSPRATRPLQYNAGLVRRRDGAQRAG